MRIFLKLIDILLVMAILFGIGVPLLLEHKVENILKEQVRQNSNATLEVEEINISLFKHFPHVKAELVNIALVNQGAFAGDTLFVSKAIALQMPLATVFRTAEEPLRIQSLTIDQAKLHLKTDQAGNNNYTFAKTEADTTAIAEADTTAIEEPQSRLVLALESYAIKDTEIIYEDHTNGMRLALTGINHSGTGDLSLEKSELQTTTHALVSLEKDSTNYLYQHKLSLEARIGIDLMQNRYTFLDNKALINQLPLTFDGFVQVHEETQTVDLTFTTPSSDFKNFLAALPEVYAKNIENVQTTGNFEVNGRIQGVIDAEHLPTFHITLNAEKASFHYPNLPKPVQNIYLHATINNSTGLPEDTVIDLTKLSFTLGGDPFTLSARIAEPLGNPKVHAQLNGSINLAHLSQAYPLPESYSLKGTVKADITTDFEAEALRKKQYQNIKTQGKASLTGFEYPSTALKHPLVVDLAAITFAPQTVSLNTFTGKTGTTDFKVTGQLHNLMGFLLNDESMKGRFKASANTFALSDFEVEDPQTTADKTTPAPKEPIKIPTFIDGTLEVAAANVLYDNLRLSDVQGTLSLKDGTATLQKLTSRLFGGTLRLSGTVSTQEATPTFALHLGMQQLSIEPSFAALDLFKILAPVTRTLMGKINADIALSGNLTDTFVPDWATTSGDLTARLLSAQIDVDRAPLVNALKDQMAFLDLESWNLNNLQTALRFSNGTVTVQPFTLRYKDIPIQVEGTHTFDQQLHYTATFQVPAQYLGAALAKNFSQIDAKSLEGLTVPITAHIGGSYLYPTVRTDIATGVQSLAAQLVDRQKQKLINQGKAKVETLFSKAVQKQAADSTPSKTPALQEMLDHLLSDDEERLSPKDAPAKTATSILGKLLSPAKKDTVK